MDVMLVSLSDMHSGGMTALYPDYPMTFQYDEKNTISIPPNEQQRQIYNHFIHSADEIKRLAVGKRLIITHNGDAIDGYHHNSVQVVSTNTKHHTLIHIELMGTFLERVGFSVKNGDELHYTSGTETHTGWEEYGIKEHFEPLGAKYHDEMRIRVNGREIWYTHHGTTAGKGANVGNGHRNWMRDIYYDCVKSGETPPDLIVTSHYHQCHYGTFVDSFTHTMHGIILPSWQAKTRYAIRAAPFQRNDIGLVYTVINDDGDMRFGKILMG
jgi:hypothetical protein